MEYICKFIFTILFLSLSSLCSADEIRLKYVNSPLSEIITHIRDDNSLSVSFDQGELIKYKITIDTIFSSGFKAVSYLTKGLPFTVSQIDGVIVISPLSFTKTASGTITDSESGESLPYASIIFDNKVFISDANGLFRISSTNALPLKLLVRYLGYRLSDTTLEAGTNHNIKMSAIHIELKEALVKDIETAQAMQMGEQSGVIRINHLIAQYMPGNGDNSVFNLLRMMPGIRAAGEPSELSVWGSKPGESAVLFDGFRLFSMNGFNEQISSINPYMVKEIRLFKGGYNSSYGNQTGAIADIIGVDGRRELPTLKFNINNLTANLFISSPLGKKISLSAAYRQTYYGLYDVNKLNPYGQRANNQTNYNSINSGDSIYITPNYIFRDANIKLSGKVSNSDSYFISLYGASDNFKFSVTGDNLNIDAYENNIQFAGGGGYNKIWGGGSTSKFMVKYSLLDNRSVKASKIRNADYSSISADNLVEETGASVRHSILLLGSNNIDMGLGFDRFKDVFNNITNTDGKIDFYVNDRINLKRLQLNLGARADFFRNKFYIQPRASLQYTISDNIAASFSWGIYNQFLGKVPMINENGISSFIWRVLGSEEFPVTGAMHSILNITYSNLHWLVSMEGYNKSTWGLTRLYRSFGKNNVVKGESTITGIDLFTKWESRGSQIFGSFSVAQSKESYMMTTWRDLSFTPFEIKIGGLWNISPLFISAEYVYADGFSEQYGTGKYSNYVGAVYSRLDIAATYSFKIRRKLCKTGISILNLLNASNVKTLDVLPTPAAGSQAVILSLYVESIPFTPTIFLSIAL